VTVYALWPFNVIQGDRPLHISFPISDWTRTYGTRLRGDRDIWFSVRDEIETETFPPFHEAETFGNYVSRPSWVRDAETETISLTQPYSLRPRSKGCPLISFFKLTIRLFSKSVVLASFILSNDTRTAGRQMDNTTCFDNSRTLHCNTIATFGWKVTCIDKDNFYTAFATCLTA